MKLYESDSVNHCELRPMNEAGIPDDLKAMPRWVIWRNEKTNSGTTKVPYQARYHRQHAKSNGPSTWADDAQAIAA